MEGAALPCGIRDLSSVFASRSGEVFADALEVLVGHACVLEGKAYLLLGLGTQTIVARRFGSIAVRDCNQALDLVRRSAAPTEAMSWNV